MFKPLLLLMYLSTLTISLAASSFFTSDAFTNTKGLPLLNAYKAQNGVNKIFYDSKHYYVGADLKYDDSQDTTDNNFGADTVPMQLSLYTNSIWLSWIFCLQLLLLLL